jgi:hypothetical protein
VSAAESIPMQPAANPSGDTLATKLSRVMKACGYVQKDGYNNAQSYKFASAAAILWHVNQALAQERVFPTVKPEIVSSVDVETRNGGVQHLITVRVELTLHDGDTGETLVTAGLGSGQDSGDKAIMKAQTAANKYAWMLALNVATGDDPEADVATDEASANNQRAPAPRATSKPAAQRQPASTARPAANQTTRTAQPSAASTTPAPAPTATPQPTTTPARNPAAAPPAAAAAAAPTTQASPTTETGPLGDWLAALDAIHTPDEAVAYWGKKPAGLAKDDLRRAWNGICARVAPAVSADQLTAMIRAKAQRKGAPASTTTKPAAAAAASTAKAAAAPSPAEEAQRAYAAEIEQQLNEAEHPGVVGDTRLRIARALAERKIATAQGEQLLKLCEKIAADFKSVEQDA